MPKLRKKHRETQGHLSHGGLSLERLSSVSYGGERKHNHRAPQENIASPADRSAEMEVRLQ
jgi:hypothetical protein